MQKKKKKNQVPSTLGSKTEAKLTLQIKPKLGDGGENTTEDCLDKLGSGWKGSIQFSSVQSLSHVQLFATPWTVARQASLSITNSRSLLRLMSIVSQ